MKWNALGAALLALAVACGGSEEQASGTSGDEAQQRSATSRPTPPPPASVTQKPAFGDLEVLQRGALFVGGQPDAAALQAAADAGVVAVVNLREDDEMTWDEATAARDAGLAYHSVPVSPRQGLTAESLAEISGITDAAGGPVLVHCASGGRANQWLAAHLVQKHVGAQANEP